MTPTLLPDAARAADPIVSVLVISYNTQAMTLDCIASVLEQTTVPYELIVLDSFSTLRPLQTSVQKHCT